MARLCILAVAILFVSQGQSKSIAGQSKSIFQPLAEYVSSKSQPFVPPQSDPSKPVMVDARIGVTNIEEVDRQNNMLHVKSWFAIIWNSSITWDPKDYNGLSKIGLPSFAGYCPTFASLQSAGNFQVLTSYDTLYSSNGLAELFVWVQWKMMCVLSGGNTCVYRFMSRDYSNDVIAMVDPSSQKFNMNKAMEKYRYKDSKYQILSESYTKGSRSYKGMVGEYDWLEYSFTFMPKIADDEGPLAVFKWH